MKFKFSLFILLLVLALSSCELKKESRMTIIPKPQKVVVNSGEFKINRNTKIIIDEEDLQINKAVKYLHNRINTACGYDLPIKNSVDNLSSNYIHFKLTDNSNIIKEGYLLNVENDRIVMEASTPAGFFYAVQTIFQLLPPEIYGYEESSGAGWQIPAVSISDKPRFPWRGMHLDVGRHYFDKEFIKKYIDLLAMHKMNKFHWHLTEDQGWRIEIKKYPRLTEISSVRQETMGDGKPYGGYYTQEDIKEIIEYAEDRFITIIPEIEMPGHSVAVLAAYPELACTDGPFEVATEWGIHKDVYCAGNEKTFQFLEDVLTEVIDLFPSKYIHIGGDECPKDRWKGCTKCQARIKNKGLKDEHELQSYFIKRIEKLLSLKGKNLIGWDEILEGGLAPQATVMSWRGIKGGVAAAQQNHDVIMSPTSHCYFDYFQGSPLNEPTAFGGYLPISKVYSYEPIPDTLTEEEAKHVLGAQANVWTEYMLTSDQVEYMAVPRIAAIAEVVWTEKKQKYWDDFLRRLIVQLKRYDSKEINYAKSVFDVSISPEFNSQNKNLMINLSSENNLPEIYYTHDGSNPSTSSLKYSAPIQIDQTTTIHAGAFINGELVSKVTKQKLIIHKAFGKKVETLAPYAKKYSSSEEFAMVDGMTGSNHFSDSRWQGYEEVDFEAVIDLGEEKIINKLSSNYYQKIQSWIFMPKYVEYFVSNDGKQFTNVAKIINEISENDGEVLIQEFSVNLEKFKTRYIKVFAKNIEVCPNWHRGAGEKAWVFVDEIIIE